jgi:integrase/recombinase XerD
MARRSNSSIKEILLASKEYISFDDSEKELDRKITLATECFTTRKDSELTLRDRAKLSKENALTVCNYIINYRREVNASPSTIRITVQHLYGLSNFVGIKKQFVDMMASRDNIASFLDGCRKSEKDDPMHKWVSTYNIKREVLIRFFKWLCFPNVSDPKARDKLSAANKEPKCIQDIPKLKIKELSSYKPSDMWTAEEDLLLLKYVTNKRDRCYHTMARDTSARPHELLGLKIKDVMFKVTPDGTRQYAEVLLNGKTGSRPVPLIQSVPYVQAWLSDHPRKNIPNSYLFVSLNNQSNSNNYTRPLSSQGLYGIYDDYKKVFFPALLKDAAVPNKDKEEIKVLLNKPWNPYVRRHTGATEKSGMLNDSRFRQYGGWSPRSKMPQVYTHYFGNESSKSLLEAYGIPIEESNSPSSVELLSPKTCPICKEGNTPDAKFCVKCNMVLMYDEWDDTRQQRQQKELQIQKLQQKLEQLAAQTDKEKDQMKGLQRQVEENKRSQSGIMEWVKGLMEHLGIPADKNILWDMSKKKQAQISFCDGEEYEDPNLVAGLRKKLGIPPDKNVVWDWTKPGGVSVYDEEEWNRDPKHKPKGPVRYYHKPG